MVNPYLGDMNLQPTAPTNAVENSRAAATAAAASHLSVELSVLQLPSDTFQRLGLDKIKSIKESHPEEFRRKLESNAELLERKYV